MATAHLHEGPMKPEGGMHHGWHDLFDHVRHTPRDAFAFFMGLTVLAGAGGVAAGRLTNPSEAAASPQGQPGGAVAIGSPSPSKSTIAPETPSPTPSGVFNNSEQWNATCLGVANVYIDYEHTTLTPHLDHITGPSPDPSHQYTTAEYLVNDDVASSVTTSEHGSRGVTITDAMRAKTGSIIVRVLNFPDKQPQTAQDLQSQLPQFHDNFPTATVVECAPLNAFTLQPN